jgi:hypothetical protein
MDEGRKCVSTSWPRSWRSLHMETADDLFGTPYGSPRTITYPFFRVMPGIASQPSLRFGEAARGADDRG